MKELSLYAMVLLYVAAGVNHFWNPSMYRKIMPPYLPYPMPLVYISGLSEIVLGLLLIPVTTRPTAAWLIIALLVAIFPANIQMSLNYWKPSKRYPERNHHPYFWLTILRLPLQFVLIAWAWSFTKA